MALAGAFASLLIFAYLVAPRDASATSKIKGLTGRKIVREISKNRVTLVLQFSTVGTSESSDEDIGLGPHSAQLVVNPKTCKNPGFWIRLVGPTLVNVHLVEATNKAAWTGSFSIPVQGTYHIDARWYGCDGQGKSSTPLPDPVTLQAVGTTVPTDTNISLFSTGSSWTSSKGMESGDIKLSDYIWKNPDVPAQSFLKTAHSVLLKEGTVSPNGFFAFGDLGNYELLW
jgi:hypothetical protein